jgi:photosystem II stability/assembly factor-like uncharacterized protein
VTAPAAASFTAAASGTPAPTLQWQVSTDGGTTFTNVAGATAGTLTIDPTAVGQNGNRYRAVATNAAGSATSNAATLTVNAPIAAPTITTQPASVTVTQPATATFTVVAAGTAPLSYRWQRLTAGTFVDLAGATAASYTTGATTRSGDDGAQFRVIVTNAGGSVTSNTVTLTVNAPPSPSAGLVCSRPNGEGWCWSDRQPIGATLRAVTSLGGGVLVAIGEGGTLLRSADDGQTWAWAGAARPGFAQSQVLNAIAVSPVAVGGVRRAVVVGWNDLVLVSNDNGATWTTTATAPTAGSRLTAVTMVDAQTIVVASDAGGIARSTDGGATWTNVVVPNFVQRWWAAAANGSTVLVVGDSNQIRRSTDGGATFAAVAGAGSANLLTVGFLDANTVVAMGTLGAIVRSTNAGQTWASVTNPATTNLASLSVIDATRAFAVSENATNSVVLRTSDGGATWTQSPVGASGDAYRALVAVSPTTAVVVGSRGRVQRTVDGGATWTRIGREAVASGELQSVAFAGTSTVLVSRRDTVALARSTDGGTTWTTVNTSGFGPPVDLAFGSATVGLAVLNTSSAQIGRTTDAGATWTVVGTPATGSLRAVAARGNLALAVGGSGRVIRSGDAGATWTVPDTGGATMGLRDAAFASDTVAVIVGSNGTILRSTDGGLTFTAAASGTTVELVSVAFADANTGLATGNNMVVRTTDGGLTWAPSNTGLATTTPLPVNRVAWVDANTAILVRTLGNILRSTDRGQTWTRVDNGIGTESRLVDVAFASPTLGVAVGSIGDGQEEVLLRTTTGGL